MLSDKEIKSNEDDTLGINEDVIKFSKKYITSKFNGSLLLSGKWGIGKTSFLNNVEASLKSNKKIRFVKINFWLEDWNAKPSELIVKNLYPILFFGIKFLPIIFTLILALLTAIIQLLPINEGNLTSNSIIIWLTLIIMTSISTMILDKFSTEAFFTWMLSIYLKNSNRKKKIIFIFDDFDRIEKEKRMYLHSTLFSLSIYENIVLIIVGEYSKISEKEHDSLFTQKIIGTVVNMPIESMAVNVWDSFEKLLKKYPVDEIIISEQDRITISLIKDIFILEKRTMREAKHLFNIFETKFFDHNINRLNYGEQLAICYIFQFHNSIYEWIVDNKRNIYEESMVPNDHYIPQSGKAFVLKIEIQKEIDYKVDEKLYFLIYSIFKNENKQKRSYLSISKSDNFHLYQIQNTNINNVISIKDVENIFIKEKSNIELIIKLIKDGKIAQFYHLFENNYLGYNGNSSANIDLYEYLLQTTAVIEVTEMSLHSSYTRSYTEIIFSEVLDYLVKVCNQNSLDLFIKLISSEQRLDLSEKFQLFNKFDEYLIDDREASKVIVQLFRDSINANVIEQHKVNTYYYTYNRYYNYFDDVLIEGINNKLDDIFTLADDEFYVFIKKHFLYNVLRLENSNLELFNVKLKSRIDTLDDVYKQDLYELLRKKY